MILGAFGDSFLFGSDLSDCQQNYPYDYPIASNITWPALIAKKLKLDYNCYAVPGIGNKIISDDILRAIYTHKSQMFYVINWTWIDRFDFIDINDKFEKWATIRPTSDKELSKMYFKHLHSELNDKITNLMYITNVINCLIKYNCSFIMTYMDYLLFDTRWNVANSVKIMQSECNGYLQLFNNLNFLDWSKKNGFEISSNWHPLEQAHQSAADYLLPTVNHLLQTKYPGGETNETI